MEKVLVLDFGGHYNQPIARKVREQNVYAEIVSYQKITADEIVAQGYKGIIFTGGPDSVFEPDAPHCDSAILSAGLPILGIGYGCQLIAYMAGGKVTYASEISEFGETELISDGSELLDGFPPVSICWMSHRNHIKEAPLGFHVTAYTERCPVAAMENSKDHIYGVQFHPEMIETEYGELVLHNFLYNICGCEGEWKMDRFVDEKIAQYRERLADKKVLLALSGGVDSSVAAVLVNKAIGDNLTCVFVDTGLLRKDEADHVEKTCRDILNINFTRVDAADRFLAALKGVTSPDEKRRIIGEEFNKVFEEEAKKIGKVDCLVQGTIYSDLLERGAGDITFTSSGEGALHQVVEYDEMAEPLRTLFKDEVRKAGLALGMPEDFCYRQPFPGPGLAIRCVGEITKEKLDTLREADAIFREEIAKSGYDRFTNQYFAVMTDTHSVGVLGEERVVGSTIVLRSVTSDDFMTADWSRIPYEILATASARITGEVAGITRIVYDITPKPPATVEWQ